MPTILAPVDLLGRDRELEVVRGALAAAREGRGRLVVVSGEPGIGKSTLAAAIAGEAAAGGVAVAQGRAWELGEAPAYFPVGPCLRALGVAPGDDAFALFEQVLAALAAAPAPVLWVVEDLHAADAQTLDLLCFLAQPLRAVRAVVLVTTRPGDPRTDPPAERRLARLARDGLVVPLAPLGAGDVATLAARSAGRALPPSALARLIERTGGNPLFVVECARAWRGGADLPATVGALIGERLDLLPAPTRAVVAAAAVLDEPTAATLAAMTDRLPARVIDDLQPAVRAGIVVETAPGRFRFAHALVRDAVLAALSAEERQQSHACAAAALAGVERAHHALAGRTPDAAAVATAVIDELVRQGTFDRAFALGRQLLEVRRGAADLARAASLALAAGHVADSRALALDALAAARAAGDVDRFAAAALTLGGVLRPGVIDAVLVEHLREALRLLGDAPSPARCRIAARLAAAEQPAADPLEPVARARAAIADARAMHDDALLRDVLRVASSAMVEIVDPTEVRALSRELLALALPARDDAAALRAYSRLVITDLELGDITAMEDDLDAMLRLAATADPRLTWPALLLGSMRAIARGRFDESERHVVEAQRVARLTDDPALSSSLTAHLFLRAVELHQTEVAELGVAAMAAETARLPNGPVVRAVIGALIWLRLDRPDRAAPLFAGFPVERALARAGAMVGGLGEVVAALGTPAQRRLLRDALAARADRHQLYGYGPMLYAGPHRRALGLLEASLGDRAAADAHLAAALATARAWGFATWECRIGLELGALRGDRGLLAGAAALADQLGMSDLAARAHALAGDAAPATAPAPPRRFELAREGDVWRVALGDRPVRVQHTRGLELLARLVARPDEELHVLVLASDAGAPLVDGDAGEQLDERAARAYRARLAELDDELATADPGRTDRLVREREALLAELARAFGLDGARRAGAASERARVNVQRRLKEALRRIGQADPAIGEYLRKAVRTGTYCTFRP